MNSTRPDIVSVLVCALSVSVAGGCAPEPDAIARGERTAYSPKTTHGDIARSNLDARVHAARSRLALDDDSANLDELVRALLLRARMFGSYDDWDEVSELLNAAREDADVLTLRVEFALATHRFDAVEEMLSRMPDDARRQALRDTLELHTGGELDDVVRRRTDLARSTDSFTHRARAASALAAAGDYALAEQWYERARSSYGDASPFPLSELAFQRGLMWSEFVDAPDDAKPHYEEAVSRTPGYVTAHVHLAELQDPGDALAQLEPVAILSSDPEAAATMASLLEPSDPGASARWRARAHQRYDALLARYPYAFADHAAEFHLADGSAPERALELALRNLEQRRTDRAWSLAIRAARAARHDALACDLAREAGVPRVLSVAALVRDVLASCSTSD